MRKDSEIMTINDALVFNVDTEGKSYPLTPTANRTVQPIALMRLGVFVPAARNKPVRGGSVIDASDDLRELEIAKSEGYTSIMIRGNRLDMSTDFKTWIGTIRAFSKYGVNSNKIELPFTEFAKLSGIAVDDINKRSRDRFFNSLNRLASVVISFKNKNGTKAFITHLLNNALYDIEKDTIVLEGDARLWELYAFDHKVLLQLKAIQALPRKESAQALYVYIESMPSGFIKVSLERLRDRLNLTSSIGTQNLAVRNAMKELEKIGYLTYSEVKKEGAVYFLIHSRRPELLPGE
ncbi:protein RepA [Chimaeribacter arupi]|uniref:Protein RepA n=1 Tax=Chimaeribacter arupi TaxID=2060066 RepID=A0A2N5EL15_9GAMM|nr:MULTISPECIES: RepB family plasmid replication initiator protein [Yersiniaceae]MDV5142073.1 protein RepA [Chimaeribacter arupi]PLR32790.1 protein RepA [Chimaeribacter arupi]PLR43173.1 protein RepA [Chimaeribacter arupi]PLR47416.1 protein RepA [Chimaeribacter arupi]